MAMTDNIEPYILQKQVTLPARVRRRDQLKIGISFEDQRSNEPRRAIDEEMVERVTKIENEFGAMRRLLAARCSRTTAKHLGLRLDRYLAQDTD